MKKILFLITLTVAIVTLSFANYKAKASIAFDDRKIEELGGSYQVTSRTNNDELDYGIRYIRDVATSSSKNLIGGTGSIDPQVVNVLEVPTSGILRMVNWSYSSSSSWSKQTIRKMAIDFEKNNPGWIVLAGINGDFFDINGKNKALPYQTNGACVNNGDVVRPIRNENQIGFTNNGTKNSLIGNKNFETTDYHVLAIYDNDDNIIKTFNVDKLNTAPTGDEISIYYFYRDGSGEEAVNVSIKTPANNSYIVEEAERCYAMSDTRLFGKGKITSKNVEKDLVLGEFAVVTSNKEVQSYLDCDVKIRVQQDIIGDYKDCENVTGGGATLIENGVCINNENNNSSYRHPRTVIGKKADGTIVLATVDGRQQAQGMYGMTYEELSCMMSYYGCTDAYNLDGGGSTTMLIRNDQDDFDVVNSPSDGSERSDSNAVLVVVPSMKLNIEEVTDTTASFSHFNKAKGITVSNVIAKINDKDGKTVQQKEIKDGSLNLEGLSPNMDYTLVYEYDLKYKDYNLHNTKSLTFSTGSLRPTLTDYYYTIEGDNYVFNFTLSDPSSILIQAYLSCGKLPNFIRGNVGAIVVPKDKITKDVFTIVLEYNVGAYPSSSSRDVYTIEELKVEEPPKEETKKKCGKKSSVAIVQLLAAVSLAGIIIKRKEN